MPTPWSVEQFEDHRGQKPVEQFLGTLLPAEVQRLLKRLQYAKDEGMQVPSHIVDFIETGIYELRAENSTNNPRILFTTIETRIVLLHGFAKVGRAGNKIPLSELQIARQRRATVLEREQEEEE